MTFSIKANKYVAQSVAMNITIRVRNFFFWLVDVFISASLFFAYDRILCCERTTECPRLLAAISRDKIHYIPDDGVDGHYLLYSALVGVGQNSTDLTQGNLQLTLRRFPLPAHVTLEVQYPQKPTHYGYHVTLSYAVRRISEREEQGVRGGQ